MRDLAVGMGKLQMPTVASRSTAVGSALTDGTAYIVPASSSGAWAGQDGNIAFFDQEWRFIAVRHGFHVLVTDETEILVYMTSAWVRMMDAISAPVILTTSTSLTNLLHNRKTINLNNTAGLTATLPAATGSGDVYELNVIATAATGDYVVAVTGNDTMFGTVITLDGDGVPANAWSPVAGDNHVIMDGSTRGGVKGDRLLFKDIAADVWQVSGTLQESATEATPFSTV